MPLLFASELLHKGLWYPTILGVLVVVAGIVLFCGSIYVLLGTNLGAPARFPRRVHRADGVHGDPHLAVVHHRLTANTIKGRIPQWRVHGSGRVADDSTIEAVHSIQKKANRVDPTEAANVKAAVDAVLVPR